MICFDGEIDNRDELRKQFPEAPEGDAGLALHAFLARDVGAFSHMRGPFAAAVWQPSAKRLMLARDRLGIKPLYFARRAGNLYFGSELKAILAHPEIVRELDLASLADYLSLNYVPGPRTLVESVKKLPPGTWLRWDAGNVTTGVYWRLEMKPDAGLTLEAAKGELDGLLRSAVADSTATGDPVAVWVGGGLEHSAVLQYASESGKRLKVYSVALPGNRAKDRAVFRQAAEAVGAEYRELEMAAGLELAGVVEELGYYCDEPNADPAAGPLWLLARLSRQETNLGVTGRGAVELFGGSAALWADRQAQMLRALPAGVRKLVAQLARLLPVSGPRASRNYRLARMIEGSLLDPVEAHFFWEGSFSREQQRALRSGWAVNIDADPVPLPAGSAGDLNRFLWIDQLYSLPDSVLHTFDSVTMAHAYPMRLPFLDHRVVEFAARLPQNLKIRAERPKFVLAELLKDRAQQSPLQNLEESRVTEFEACVQGWFRGPLRPLLLDTLDERTVRDSGILEWPAVEGVIRAHLEDRANLGYHLWGLVILFLWMKRWGIAAPSRSEEPHQAMGRV